MALPKNGPPANVAFEVSFATTMGTHPSSAAAMPGEVCAAVARANTPTHHGSKRPFIEPPQPYPRDAGGRPPSDRDRLREPPACRRNSCLPTLAVILPSHEPSRPGAP